MKNYIVAILMKRWDGEVDDETLTLVRVSLDEKGDVLRTALRDNLIIDLTAKGFRFEMFVCDEIK